MEQATQTNDKVAKLGQVAKLNDAAQKAFETFGQRQRFRSNTNLKRFQRELELKYKTAVDDKQLLETFKGLEDAGMGSLIIGRKSQNTRFAWQYSLRDVAKLAKGEISANEVTKIPSRPVKHRIKRANAVAVSQPIPEPVQQASATEVIIIKNGDVKRLNLTPDKIQMFQDMVSVFEKGA